MRNSSQTGWIAGQGWGVIAPGVLAWFGGDADLDGLGRLYAAAVAGRPATELVRLAEESVGGTHPTVGIAVERQGHWAVTLRGLVACDVGLRGTAERHAPGAGGTLHRADVASPTWLRLGPASASPGGPVLPVVSGVIACGGVLSGDPSPAALSPPKPAGAGPETAPPASLTPAPPGPLPPPATRGDNPFAELWGHTIRRPVEAAAVREVRDTEATQRAEEAPTTTPRDDAAKVPDGATLVGSAIDDEPACYGTATASTGGSADIRRYLVIGRAPAVPEGETGDLLRVANPGRDVSRSHVALRVRHQSVAALDLRSNNGTRLLRPGALPTSLSVDKWTLVRSGDVLELAAGVTITLEDLP